MCLLTLSSRRLSFKFNSDGVNSGEGVNSGDGLICSAGKTTDEPTAKSGKTADEPTAKSATEREHARAMKAQERESKILGDKIKEAKERLAQSVKAKGKVFMS